MIEVLLGAVATGVGGYLTVVLRELHQTLDRQDKHETALFGDEELDWPGVVELATENRALLTDGGEEEGNE